MQAYQIHFSAQAGCCCLVTACMVEPDRKMDRSAGGERRVVPNSPGRARPYSAHSTKHRRRRR